MNVDAAAGSLSLGTVGGQVDLSVMKSIQNLTVDEASRLFSSIGLGSTIDAYA